jgi:hypothetical protein
MPDLLRLQRLRISATNTIVVFVVRTISLFPPPAVPVFGTTPGDRYKNSVGGQVKGARLPFVFGNSYREHRRVI